MNTTMRAHGVLTTMRAGAGQEGGIADLMAAWHGGPGRVLPGTRLHLLFDAVTAEGELVALHVFESEAAWRRCAASPEQRAWDAEVAALLREPPTRTEVAVRWNAAGMRPRASVSIDRDVHASVQDLIARLLDRHPRTPAENAYLAMLQSVAADYEAEFPPMAPEEGDPR